MLFKVRIAALVVTILVIGAGITLVSGRTVEASLPDVLEIDHQDVLVGQILDTGVKSGNDCIMTYEAIEISVDVSINEPSAGVTLMVDDDCRLLVEAKYRDIETVLEIPQGATTSPNSNYPRYAVWARGSYRDFAGIDLATTRVQYNYEERPDEFLFTFDPYEYCHTVSWWNEEECRIDSQHEGSASISATAYGRYSWHVTGSFRHKQKATFTAESGGQGTAICWTNTQVSGLKFECDGDINHSN